VKPGTVATFPILLGLLAAGHASAQDMRPFSDPSGRFTLQYPKKNWQVLPGGGSTLATLAEKNGRATVHIEYLRLNQPLKVDQDHDLIVQTESSLIRERQPGATGIQGGPERPDLPGFVSIDFTRPGASGPEHVRQFSVVQGNDLFRILCVARLNDFQKFETIFQQIARSFRTTASP
jgi:hypothetical protein